MQTRPKLRSPFATAAVGLGPRIMKHAGHREELRALLRSNPKNCGACGNERGLLPAFPILDFETWNASQVSDVRRDEDRVRIQRVSRDRHVEIVEAEASSFELGFELSEPSAHRVRPRCPLQGTLEDSPSIVQEHLAARPRQACQAILDFRNDRLRYSDLAR